MIEVNIRKLVTIMLAVILAAGLMAWLPVSADDDETSMGAEVEVLPGEAITYGAKVGGSRSVLFPGRALGKPDNRGAFIIMNGWISVVLKNSVNNTGTISVWAANRGWQSSNIKIYTSADGRKWKLAVVEKVKSSHFTRYDFTGSFGNVKYVKVDRSGGRWSGLLLDAVGVRGGDT